MIADLVIRTGELTKRFGRVLALDSLNLEVRTGEVLVFLGPNSAGKTTTLRLLMGYLRPTAGSARSSAWTRGGTVWRSTPGQGTCLPGEVRL